MATTRSFTSSYSGDDIRSYILRALTGGETLSTDGLNIQTGVKYKRAIKRFTSADIVQSGSCSFNPVGTLTISEGVLEPQKMKINEQICFEDVYQLWDAESMADGMNEEEMPQELVDAVVEEFVGRFAEYVENHIWQGDLTGATYVLFDGYEKLLDNGSPVDVTATTITAANVLAEMAKVTAAQPKAIKLKPASQKVLFVTPEIAELYQQSLDAQGLNTSIDEKAMAYHGIEVRAVGGLSAGKMVLGLRDNFYFGTDLMSDWTDINILDQRQIDGSDFVNFVMKAKADVAIGWTQEVVYYA